MAPRAAGEFAGRLLDLYRSAIPTACMCSTRGAGCAGLSAADGPPPGFRMMDFDDVPLPVAGEPARLYDVYPPAPPPRRFLAPPPAFIVGLPPPPRPGGGLWRRQQPAFPMIVNPGPRPGHIPGQGFGGRPPGQGFPEARRAASRPEGSGDRQSAAARRASTGFQGPPKAWQKPGTGIGAVPPGPPPGFKGQQQFQKGPPTGPEGQQRFQPGVVNQPPPGPPQQPGFQGPPKAWQKPGTGIGTAPPQIQQQQIQQQQIQQQIQRQQIQQQQLQIAVVLPAYVVLGLGREHGAEQGRLLRVFQRLDVATCGGLHRGGSQHLHQVVHRDVAHAPTGS